MNVLFFASLRERLGCDQVELVDASGINTPQDIINQLIKRGTPWDAALKSGKLLVSVNQEIASLSSPINPEDEIAFFPPVTGG